MSNELHIEDILSRDERKKTIKSGQKGKRKERELCKLLTKRFGDIFSRSVGSGNRIRQVRHLPKHAQETFSGDVVCPENFKWVFECKGGYNDIDLNNAFDGGITLIDQFLEQAEKEGENTQRKPILCWKKDRRPWVAFVHAHELVACTWWEFKYYMRYGDWIAVSLEELLQKEDSFWRETKKEE